MNVPLENCVPGNTQSSCWLELAPAGSPEPPGFSPGRLTEARRASTASGLLIREPLPVFRWATYLGERPTLRPFPISLRSCHSGSREAAIGAVSADRSRHANCLFSASNESEPGSHDSATRYQPRQYRSSQLRDKRMAVRINPASE